MKKTFATLILMLITTPVFASSDLSEFTGYTIVGNKTIIGWHDENGKSGDSFDGCDFDRVIVFDDNTTLTCTGYNYQYAYRPTATILVNGSGFKMVVEDETYDMRQ